MKKEVSYGERVSIDMDGPLARSAQVRVGSVGIPVYSIQLNLSSDELPSVTLVVPLESVAIKFDSKSALRKRPESSLFEAQARTKRSA